MLKKIIKIFKGNYLPIIDEISFFMLRRGEKYNILKQRKRASIHETVRIGVGCKIDKNVTMGENSYCGTFCHFFAGENSKVVVGKYCAIGHNVHIKARTHDLKNATPSKNSPNKRIEKDIIIGNNVWLGDNVFIKEGVKIGDNSVIGANSVVTKDVPDNEIHAGVPAKKIKELS